MKGTWRIRACLALLGTVAAGSAAMAQSLVPVVRIPEAGGTLQPEPLNTRAPGALTWTQKREILQQNRIIAPPQPPSEFELTPRAPHRLPGGYLSVGVGLRVSTKWDPNAPDNTGALSLAQVDVVLSGLRRNTNYLFDLFVSTYSSSGTAKLTVRSTCHYGGGGPVAAEFPITGARHVFVVLPTNTSGGGCFQVASDASASLFKVQASELGAVP